MTPRAEVEEIARNPDVPARTGSPPREAARDWSAASLGVVERSHLPIGLQLRKRGWRLPPTKGAGHEDFLKRSRSRCRQAPWRLSQDEDVLVLVPTAIEIVRRTDPEAQRAIRASTWSGT
jgi:hypothetical protein